jgi:3-deoxy-D-manno-octulosonic-acid transferase
MVSKPENHLSPIQRWLYPHALDAVYAATLLAMTPYLVASRQAGHSYGHVVRRRGNVRIPAHDRPRLWIHGVSVGEVLSVRSLVARIEEGFPEWSIAFSATSQAGLALVRRTYQNHSTFEYPFDFSWAVRRTLRRVRPDLIFIVEHELWPNFLNQAHFDGVPVVLVNSQISDRSIRGYRLLSRFIRWPPPAIVHYCAQDVETRERLYLLGVEPERITVTGNLKYDNACQGARDLRDELAYPRSSWLLVAASTHPGEEEILLGAFGAVRARDPGARLVLIPRKVDRVPQLRRLVQRHGYTVHQRSLTNGGPPVGADPRGVLLVDTLGELPAFCRTADLVFVGGTLVPFGGHNVIEPASLGKPVVVGPHCEHFRSVIRDFQKEESIALAGGPAALSEALLCFHGDRELGAAMGERARRVVEERRGASERTFQVVARIMESIAAFHRAPRNGQAGNHP